QQEGLRRRLGLQRMNGPMLRVRVDWKWKRILFRLLGDDGRIRFIRANADERHAAVAVAPVQLSQVLRITCGHRALERKENDHNGLLVFQVVECRRLAGGVCEMNVINLLVEQGGRWSRLCTLGSAPHGSESRQRDEQSQNEMQSGCGPILARTPDTLVAQHETSFSGRCAGWFPLGSIHREANTGSCGSAPA